MSVKHLSKSRDLDDFFSKLKKHDLINYHPTYTAEMISEKGRDFGLLIEYCWSESAEYQKHGEYICRVVDKLSHNQRIITPIKEAMIATNFTKSWVNKKALKNFK